MARKPLDQRISELPEPPTSAAASRVYLDLTLEVLRRHSAVLGELRTRASIVLTATGIVASLLGSEGLKNPHPEIVVYVALAFLGLGVVMCIAVLWPLPDKGDIGAERKWQVTPTANQAAKLASAAADQPFPDELINVFATARLVNYDTLERRTTYFNAACVSLLFQLAAWVVVFLA